MADLQPDIWVWWRLDEVPSGSTTYEWAERPLADEDSFKEPRLRRIGNIRRECSSDDGDPVVPSCEVDVLDDDGVVRGILADAASRHGIGGEIAVRILSEASRKAGGTPSDLIRGTVARLEAATGRRARIKIAGGLGGVLSDVNLKKTFPQQRIGDEHPYAPASSKGLVYPLIIGIWSDVGATDANGNPAEKGLLPAIDVGDVLLLNDGTEVDQATYPLESLSAPEDLAATINGTSGTQSVRYAVSALSAFGETTVATLTITNAPDLLNGTDSVDLAWTASDGALAYYVYRNRVRLERTTTNSYTDVGAPTTGQPEPSSNTALTTVETATGTAMPWARFLAAGKAVHIEKLYGSDLADGGTPTRTDLEDVRGLEVLIYGDPEYPHANPYIDKGGIRQTVFYARGPRVKHHRDGVVTFAWNGWGVDAVGDGTGAVITQAFYGLEWLLNEEVLKDDGVGYLTGTYGPIETYANGINILQGSKFDRAQELSARFLRDDVGYLASVAIHEPTSLRTILRRFHQTFGSLECPSDRYGRYYPILINEYTNDAALSNNLSPLKDEATMSGNLGDETAGSALLLLSDEQRAYRDRINIQRWAGEEYKHDRVETRVVFSGGWDADAQRFRFDSREIAYDPGTFGHSDVKQRAPRQCHYSHDLQTLSDSQDRYLRRHLVAPRVMGYSTGLNGLEDDLGAEILLTHYDGSSSASGDVDRRAMVIEHNTDPEPGIASVLHRVLDLERMVMASEVSLDELQDESTMSGNLKDETSTAMPPVGAWRLR